MSHIERNMRYLEKNKIAYRRDPINDQPTVTYVWGSYYEDGTHECYELFRSKAKITTYKSLKWHLLVLWYLNTQLTEDSFYDLAMFISNKANGFVSFNAKESILINIIYEVSMSDPDYPPTNQLRKVIFRDGCNLSPNEKLQITGSLMGKAKKITEEDIYDCMLYLHDNNEKITILAISKHLNVSTRTIYRTMSNQLKKEKELLNIELKNEKI